MKVFPRSHWTALIPKISSSDPYNGLPYFDSPPEEVEFAPVGKSAHFSYKNPAEQLHLLLKEATLQSGLSDIDFNYAVAPNIRGVFVLRGQLTKCANSNSLRCLILLGDNEKPTDVLKENIRELQTNHQSLNHPLQVSTLRPGDSNVHVFNLIEYLTQHGFYKSRNDGVYGPITQHSVQALQNSLGIRDLTGVYDGRTFTKLERRVA